MFIYCPHCRALVATDRDTGLPPERCPRCAVVLRKVAARTDTPPPAQATPASVDRPPQTAPAAVVIADTISLQPIGGKLPGSELSGLDPTQASMPGEPTRHDAMANASLLDEDSEIDAHLSREPSAPIAVTDLQWVRSPSEGTAPDIPLAADADLAREPHAAVGPDDSVATNAAAQPNDHDVSARDAFATPVSHVSALLIELDNITSPRSDAVRGAQSTSSEPSEPDAPVDAGFDAEVDASVNATQDRAAADKHTPASVAHGQSLTPDPSEDVSPSADTSTAMVVGNTMQASALPAPSFARAAHAPGHEPARIGWKPVAAIAALVVVLMLQLLLADRARLAANAHWRPAMLALCNVLRCTVPAWQEPAAFVLLDRNVQPNAAIPGVLRVTATFRNDARWPQPWPRLRLTLSDIDGNAVAAREFAPREYLGAAPTQDLLATGQSASLAMDVIESDARSVAFDFQLR